MGRALVALLLPQGCSVTCASKCLGVSHGLSTPLSFALAFAVASIGSSSSGPGRGEQPVPHATPARLLWLCGALHHLSHLQAEG